MFVTDGACSMYGVDERCIGDLVAKPQGVHNLENIGVDWRIILKYIFQK